MVCVCVCDPPQALYISGSDVISAEPSAHVTAMVTKVMTPRGQEDQTQILLLIIQQAPPSLS